MKTYVNCISALAFYCSTWALWFGTHALTDEETRCSCTLAGIKGNPLVEDEYDEVHKDGCQEDNFREKHEEDVEWTFEESEEKMLNSQAEN